LSINPSIDEVFFLKNEDFLSAVRCLSYHAGTGNHVFPSGRKNHRDTRDIIDSIPTDDFPLFICTVALLTSGVWVEERHRFNPCASV